MSTHTYMLKHTNLHAHKSKYACLFIIYARAHTHTHRSSELVQIMIIRPRRFYRLGYLKTHPTPDDIS